MFVRERFGVLTKYDAGANANPPRNPRRELKKGMTMATIIVNTVKIIRNHTYIVNNFDFQ